MPLRPETVQPTVKAFVVQATETLVTLLVNVPLPEVTTQVWIGLIGWLNTVTLYAVPLASAVVKVNEPLADTARLLPPLS